MSDISDDPEFKEWAERVRAHVLPQISESALNVSLVPAGDMDVKFAVELGLSIMMDKPIIAVVQPGTKVPAKLVLVADRIVEADIPADLGKVREAIEAAMKELDDEESDGTD